MRRMVPIALSVSSLVCALTFASVLPSTGSVKSPTVVKAPALSALVQLVGPRVSRVPSTCTSSYYNTAFDGDVTVPPGANCFLRGVTVNGDVTAGLGSSLNVLTSTITGDVRAEGVSWIGFGLGNTIDGNLRVDRTTDNPTELNSQAENSANFLCNSAIGGDVVVTNSGPNAPFEIGGGADCSIAGLTVHGNLILTRNAAELTIGPAGSNIGNVVSKTISVENNGGGGTMVSNVAGESCVAKNNEPAIVGSGNTAQGRNSCNTVLAVDQPRGARSH